MSCVVVSFYDVLCCVVVCCVVILWCVVMLGCVLVCYDVL